MMVGLLETGLISLTHWAPFVHSRAVFAQSSVRRFARWLANERIEVHKLYGPLIQQALSSWGRHTLYLALEASLIRSADALTRLGLILALTTLYLVAQGTEVVKQGKRRWGDAHWFRGNSYLKIESPEKRVAQTRVFCRSRYNQGERQRSTFNCLLRTCTTTGASCFGQIPDHNSPPYSAM